MNKEIWPDISSEISLIPLQQNLIKNSDYQITSYHISTQIMCQGEKNWKLWKGSLNQ